MHSLKKPYECHVCDKKFINEFGLSQHTYIHSGHKPYECDACHTNFIYKRDLITLVNEQKKIRQLVSTWK